MLIPHNSHSTLPGRPGFDRRMTKEEINELPLRRWQGPVEVINSAERAITAARTLAEERLLGFDTETRPAFKKGQSYLPALLQLATDDKVWLFQLGSAGLPDPVRGLLTDPSIIKAGVSLGFDVAELQKIAPFAPAGFVELADTAKARGIKNHGLRGLAAVILGFRISKSARTTNWAKPELTQQQITYAATDAWVGREIYQQLIPE